LPPVPLAPAQGGRCCPPTAADDHSVSPVWEKKRGNHLLCMSDCSDLGIVTQAREVSPTPHICDVSWRCQPVHVPGAGGQLIVGEGSSGVKCVQV